MQGDKCSSNECKGCRAFMLNQMKDSIGQMADKQKLSFEQIKRNLGVEDGDDEKLVFLT